MKKVAEIGAEKRKEDLPVQHKKKSQHKISAAFKIDKASATALCRLCKKQKVCFML